MARSKSSKRWLAEHAADPFVKEAHARGYRSRAVFKLQAIQSKYRLIKPGHVVIDLGAAPGGWSEEAVQWVGHNGAVIALDCLPMDPIVGVTFLQGDFREESTIISLAEVLNGRKVDVVLSDMAPNTSGHRSADCLRAIALSELALDYAEKLQTPMFVIKLFQGEGFEGYVKLLRAHFARVVMMKPEASRARSNEVYAICFREK